MENLVKSIIGMEMDLNVVGMTLGRINKDMIKTSKLVRSHGRSIVLIELMLIATAALCAVHDEKIKNLEKEIQEIKGEQVKDNTEESLG